MEIRVPLLADQNNSRFCSLQFVYISFRLKSKGQTKAAYPIYGHRSTYLGWSGECWRIVSNAVSYGSGWSCKVSFQTGWEYWLTALLLLLLMLILWLLETRFRFNIKMILHKQRWRVQKYICTYIYMETEPTADSRQAGFVRFPMLISVLWPTGVSSSCHSFFFLYYYFFFLLLCGSFFPFFPTTELLHHQRLKDKFNRLHAANDCDFDFDQLWCFSSPHHRTFSSLFALASDRGSFQLVLYFFSLATLRKVAKFPPPKVTNLTLGTTNGYLRTRCNRTEYSPTARQRHTTLKIGHQRAMIDSRALCGRNS